jgi:outer membrane receptor for ferrienterochelin and colicin
MPGVRADYQKESAAWTVDPRFAVRQETTEELTLKGAAGVYSQPVIYYMLIPEIGNPDVDPERVLQTSLGFEVDPEARVHLDVDAFYKRWLRRIVATEGGAAPRFENTGDARAYGLETMVRATPVAGLETLLSYTLSRSERNDGRGDGWRLYTKDQTHNVSLVGSYELGAGITFGARFRYVTGNPQTPVVGAVYAAEFDQYRPVYGSMGSGSRRPAFHQLDVRVDKRWELGPVALVTYLEVFNVYNAQNEEATSYNYDFSKSEAVSGMPIFPNIGVRGEL